MSALWRVGNDTRTVRAVCDSMPGFPARLPFYVGDMERHTFPSSSHPLYYTAS